LIGLGREPGEEKKRVREEVKNLRELRKEARNTALAFDGSSGVDWQLQSSVATEAPFHVRRQQ
jgi:hypothetical protein